MSEKATSSIRIGIGGWTFEPWRGSFYPDGLAQKRELEFASSKLTAIEVNGTYYGSQKPESFAKWRAESPAGFVFSLKGPRFTTNRRVLSEAGESVERFLRSGIVELGDKLGPINWQFMATKKFDADDFEGFLKLLPDKVESLPLRHAVEVRHESFMVPEFVALARKYGVAIVHAGDSEFPVIPDPTADFVYARIMGTTEDAALGYAPKALDEWASRARDWASGEVPAAFRDQLIGKAPKKTPREVFLFVISGHKPRNPAAAMALIERV